VSKRETSIALARVAGYHADRARFTRLVIESRVSFKTMREAFFTGEQMKKGGIPCNCYECKKAA